MASGEPFVVAVPSHLQGELRIVPLGVRNDLRGDAVAPGRMVLRGIVVIHAGDPSCAAVVGSGVGGLGPGVVAAAPPVAISACSPAQGPVSTDRWLGSREPAAVLIPRTPASGSWPPVAGSGRAVATGVCADQHKSARHTGRHARGQRGDIWESPPTSDDRDGLQCAYRPPDGWCSARVAGLS